MKIYTQEQIIKFWIEYWENLDITEITYDLDGDELLLMGLNDRTDDIFCSVDSIKFINEMMNELEYSPE